MRTEDLIDVISEVDDELLERSEKLKWGRKSPWKRWLPLAACACLLLVIGIAGGNGMFSMKGEQDNAKPENEYFGNVEGDASTSDDTPDDGFTTAPDEMTAEITDSDEPKETVNENNPFKDATAANGAVTLYKYDGDTAVWCSIFDKATANEVLEQIANAEFVEVEEWPVDEVTFPIYGLEGFSEEGTDVRVAWKDNYWIKENGEVVYSEFDITKLETEYEWEDYNCFPVLSAFPCVRQLCQNGEQWIVEYMEKAEDLKGQENVTMEVTKQTDHSLNVRIDNQGREAWEYGEFYDIQVLIDGTWYRVPTAEQWAYFTIAYHLPGGESVEGSYSLEIYQPLPKGAYRIVIEGVAAEFEIE